MKTRWLRITLIAAAVPVLLCGLLLAVIATLGNTAGGRQRIESLVAYLTASQVRLQGLGGDLPDHLTLRTLQLSDTHGVWLTAADIDLHWHPWALLQRHVALETVHARRIDWLRAPVFGSRDAGPRRIPDIDVRELTGDTVNLSAALAVTAATLNLHASAHLRTLEDMQLAVAATRLDGEGTYSLQLAFDKARMDGAFRLREPLHGPLAGLLGVPDVGAVQVAGDLGGLRQAERLAVHADVGALHADVTGAVDLRQGSADLDYAADAGAMAPRADLSWRRLHLRGTWRGTPATALATGELQVLDLAAPHALRIASLDAALQAHGGDLRVQGKVSGLAAPGLPTGLFEVAPLDLAGGIDFASPSRPFSLHASHPVFTVRATGQAAGERFVDAAFDTRDVAVLLQALPGQLRGPLHLAARAQLTGERVQMRVTAAGNLDSGLIGLQPWLRGPQSADIRASYQEHELTFSPSAAASKALGLAVSGRLAAPTRPDEPWSVAAKARVTLEDLALLLPSLSGKAAIRADLSGSTAALRIAGDLQAGVAVAGSAPGSLDASFDVKGLPQAPEGRVRARGSVAGASLTLQADVQVDPGRMLRVSALQADWQSLHAQGDLTLAQELDRSHGELRCAIGNLGDFSALLGRHLAGRLAGTLTLMPPADAASTAATSLQVTADGLEVGSLPFNATLAGSGPLHALALQLAAQSTVLGAPATLRAQGHLDARRRSLTVAAATAAIRGIDLNLLQPALLDFTHGLALTGLRLSASDAVLTAAGDLAPQLRLDARLEEATPGLIDAILPGYLSSGSLLGTAQLHGTLAHPLGELRLTGTDLRAAGDAASLPLAQLSAGVDLGADGARVALRSTAGQASHLTIEGTIPWSGPIAVDASGKLDLSRLNPLLEAFGRRISGTLDVDAQVAGTLAAPAVTGALQLHGGTVHDYRHGIDLTQIEGTLAGTQAELRITRLTAHATSGTVGVTGSVGILQPGVPVDLTFTARNAQPFASSIVTASGNADLKLTGTLLHELNLAGAVAVNRATVEIPNSFPPNVAVLDVRRPGQAVAGPSTGINLNLNVTVDAPRQILVRGRGLDAELGGRVQIGGTATAPTIAGGFDLQRGVFTLAGSRLDFSSGRVGFTGTDIKGKIDPTLDFTAQTTALDASVTLRITGVADAPQFELTSVPQLPQDEILARLLFGENAGQLTALQAAQLGAALMTLTGVGTGLNPLVELQKHLGLDRLAVASNDTNTPGNPQNTGTTIEAGRYVTNRIFVNVKQNTTGATQLQMDVDLTSKLKLQTRVGTGTATVQGTTPDNDPGSSVGLSYRFEY